MSHTMEEFDACLARPELTAVRVQIVYLRGIYAEHVDRERGEDVNICTGVLTVMDALAQLPPPRQAAVVTVLTGMGNGDIPLGALGSFNLFELLSFFALCPQAPLSLFLTTLADMAPLLAPGGLVKAVGNAFTYVGVPLLNAEKLTGVVLHRLINLLGLLKTCHDAVTAEVPGALFMPSGSDGHLQNRQVLFLWQGGRPTKVYKPRPLEMDDALFRLIGYVNQCLDNGGRTEFRLPAMAITCKTGWGVEDFVGRVHAMTPAQAHLYYKKLGVLLYVAKIMGMNDIHQDNIFPTAAGPMIIDAECGFDAEMIAARSLFANCFSDAITRSESPDGTASAVFTINGAESTSVYADYVPDIQAGFQQIRVMMATDAQLLPFLDGLWRGLTFLRVVPLATADFTALFSAHQADAAEAGLWARPEGVKLKTNLSRILGPLATAQMWHTIFQQIHQDFTQGDVPYFCYRKTGTSWSFYCDQTSLGTLAPFTAAMPNDLRDNFNWISLPARDQEIPAGLIPS